MCLDAAADAVLVECGHGGICAGDIASICVIVMGLERKLTTKPVLG